MIHDPVEPPKKPTAPRVWRALGWLLARFVTLPLCLVLSVVLHLPTAQGRAAARDLANIIFREIFRGTLLVGSVDEISLTGAVRASRITVDDPQRRRILEDGVFAVPSFWALWGGLRKGAPSPMPTASLRARVLRLLPGQLLSDPSLCGTGCAPDVAMWVPSTSETFFPKPSLTPAQSQTPGQPFGLLFPSLSLSIDRLESSLGHIDATARRVQVEGLVRTWPLRVEVRSFRAEGTAFRLPVSPLRGTFVYDVEAVSGAHAIPPSHLALDVQVRGEQLHCDVHLRRETRGTEAEMTLRAEGCRASASALDSFAGTNIGIPLEVGNFQLANRNAEPFQITANGNLRGSPFELQATLAPTISAALTVHGLDLQSLRTGLPQTQLDGTIRATRTGDEFTVDTTQLRAVVGPVPAPPLTARGTLRGTQLEVASLDSEPLRLHARGALDLSDPLQRDGFLEAQFNAPELGEMPFTRGLARGVLSGSINVQRRDGVLSGNANANVRGFRLSALRVDSLQARAHLEPGPTPLQLRGTAYFQGLHAANTGPLRGQITAAGDPRSSLTGLVDATGQARAIPGLAGTTASMGADPVRLRGRYSFVRNSNGIRVQLPNAELALRGTQARVETDVEVPERGSPTVHVRVDAPDAMQGIGDTEVTLSGGRLSGGLRGVSAGWISNALGLSTPLRGTLEGHLDLQTNSPGRSSGRVVWTDASAPGIGAFDAIVESRIENTTELGADHRSLVRYCMLIALGSGRALSTERCLLDDVRADLCPREPGDPRPRMRVVALASPPNNPADRTGWIRGLQMVQACAPRFTLQQFQRFGPTGLVLDGTGEIRAKLHREHPGDPLDGGIGVELRSARPALDPTSVMSTGVRRFFTRSTQTLPLTVPFHVRAALCPTVSDPLLERGTLRLGISLDPEDTTRERDAPTRCEEDDLSLSPLQPMLQVRGGIRGPWIRGLREALTELAAHQRVRPNAPFYALPVSPETRAILQESPVEAHVRARLASDTWPFERGVRLLNRSLLTSPIAGRVTASLDVTGNAYAPELRASSVLLATELEALATRDTLEVRGDATLRPERGQSLFGRNSIALRGGATLLARTSRGEVPAGNATGHALLRGEIARVLDPNVGLLGFDVEDVDLETEEFQLGRIGALRAMNVDGLLTLTARATHDPQTPVALNATLTGLRVRSQRNHAASLNAFLRHNSDLWEVQSCAEVRASGTPPAPCDPDAEIGAAAAGSLLLRGTLPFEGRLPSIRLEPSSTHVQVAANRFRIETLSPLLEYGPILRVGGALTTERVSWTAGSPRVISGRVLLDDGLLEIERVGQPARDVTLEMRGRGRFVEVPRLSFRLGGSQAGVLEGRGWIDLRDHEDLQRDREEGVPERHEPEVIPHCSETMTPREAVRHQQTDLLGHVHLTANLRRLPAIQEGRTYGVLSAAAYYDGDFFSTGHRGEVTIENATVDVPDEPSRDVQELSPNSSVFVLGTSRVASGEGRPSQPFPHDLSFCSTTPIWVRRSDLEISVRASGAMHYDPAGLALEGFIDRGLQQSYLELFGKRFFFDRLRIEFDGSTTFDPLLDVLARFDSPSTGRITVTVSGRLRTPEITFAAEQFPGASQSDVIALLVLGRRDSRGAGEQQELDAQARQAATQLLTSLALGFASDFIRARSREGNIGVVFRPIIEAPASSGQFLRLGGGFTPTTYNRLYIEGTYGPISSLGNAPSGAQSNLGNEGRLFIEWFASDHVSIGGTLSWDFGARYRTALDVFYNP